MCRKFFILAILVPFALLARPVYIIPIGGHEIDRLFFSITGYRDEVSAPLYFLREALEEKGYEVRFTWDAANLPDFALLLAFNEFAPHLLHNLQKYPKERCVLINLEPPTVLPSLYQQDLTPFYGTIFTLFDHLVDNHNYFKLYYPQPRLQMVEGVLPFENKRLCTMIAGNKWSGHPDSLYPARRDVIAFFSNLPQGEFDLYGTDWYGYRDWKGRIPGKWEVLKQYKFSFCYESMGNQEGYITEKIFDSFVGGCVPIYWGATNITKYVPANCFIDRRDFSSNEELYDFLKKMKEEKYNGYLEAIRQYLGSPKAQLFSVQHWLDVICSLLPDTFP